MKIIDRNGRLFGKLSIIDLLVIAVVAVMAGALNVKNNQTPTGANVTEQPIAFQIRVTAARDYVADAIQVGDKLEDLSYSSGSKPIGEITKVEVVRSPGLALPSRLLNGTAEPVEVEGTVELLVTVEGWGVVTERTYAINRVYQVGLNSSRTYKTNKVVFEGVVANIL